MSVFQVNNSGQEALNKLPKVTLVMAETQTNYHCFPSTICAFLYF